MAGWLADFPIPSFSNIKLVVNWRVKWASLRCFFTSCPQQRSSVMGPLLLRVVQISYKDLSESQNFVQMLSSRFTLACDL